MTNPPIPLPQTDKIVYPSGATRTGDAEHCSFELICPTALKRLAMRYRLGETNHGADNWTKGLPMLNILKRTLSHLNLYQQSGCVDDDNLAAAAWGLFALMHHENNCNCHQQRQRLRYQSNQYLQSQPGVNR